ncbi:MAG: outer membrane beta-barrel family protein [Bacteroidota bacterium]
MKSVYPISVLLLLFSTLLIAQNTQQRNFDPSKFQPVGKISGKIIDSNSSEPIEYANLVLYRMRDSAMVNGTVSINNGDFMFEKLMPSRYYLKITYIGYENKLIDSLILRPNAPEVKLGTIKLEPKSVNVGEVVVKGQKESMIYNLDKKVLNIDQNLANSGATALEIIENIPSVTVDADGGVAVRGNPNVNILIDGKPSALAGYGSSDVLSQIPASQIESIELVTNPSAKYDPEGTGGILNVILKRKSSLGVNGSALANAGTGERYNTSLNLNLRSDDFNIFTSYDARINRFNSTSNSLRTTEYNGISSTLDQLSDNNNKMNNHNINVGGDYYFTEKDIVSLSAQFRIGDFDNSSIIDNKNYDNENSLEDYYQRVSSGFRKFRSQNYTLSYKKTFDKRTRELTADIMYSNSAMNSESNINQQYFDVETGQPNDDLSQQKSLSDNSNRLFLIQANYIQPLNELGRLEGGFKSTMKNLKMQNDYILFDPSTSEWVNSSPVNNIYDYKEQVHAAYGIYSNNYGSFSYQFGVRAEQVLIDGNVVSTGQTFENDYFSLYPSVHLRYNFSELEELQFSYSRRVDRPRNNQLNPYVDYSDSLNIFAGNPNLKAQYINSLELGYSKFFGKTSVVTSVFFKQNNDMISSISTLLDHGVTYTTYQNVAKGQSYGAEFIIMQPVFDWWRLNGTVSFFTNRIEDDLSIGGARESNSWLARINSNMTLLEDFQLQLIGSYSSPTIQVTVGDHVRGFGGGPMFFGGSGGQTKMKEQYALDAILRKDFLDGRLSLTLRITDIFNTREFNSETNGMGFYMSSERKPDSRVAYLGVSYRLDNKKNQDQDREKRIEEGLDEL